MTTAADVRAGATVAERLLEALARHVNATEAHPLTLGNVEFWLDGGQLIYGRPVSQWDQRAVHVATYAALRRLGDENPVEYGRLASEVKRYKAKKAGVR